MSRITLRVDSATPEEVYDLTLAFQRTRKQDPPRTREDGFTIPPQITTTPTVEVAGTCMTWTSPALEPAHGPALLAEYASLCEYRLLARELAS